MNANGVVYSPVEAQAVVDQWTEIAKGLVDKDLRSIQRDITNKINNRQQIPDEFLNSKHVAYRVAGVVTAEIMQRRNRQQQAINEQLRGEHERNKVKR